MPVGDAVRSSKNILGNEDVPLQISIWNAQPSAEVNKNLADADMQRSNWYPTSNSNCNNVQVESSLSVNGWYIEASSDANSNVATTLASNAGKSQTIGYSFC